MDELLQRIIHGGIKGKKVGKEDMSRFREFQLSRAHKEKPIAREFGCQKTGANTVSSYAELFKGQSSIPALNNISLDLDHAVVCNRTDFFISWEQIEMELRKYLMCSVTPCPFQLNRALFFTINKEQAARFE